MDGMFDRTSYGKELDVLAEILAEESIRDLNRGDKIDDAVKSMTGQLRAGRDMLPDMSPEFRKMQGGHGK